MHVAYVCVVARETIEIRTVRSSGGGGGGGGLVALTTRLFSVAVVGDDGRSQAGGESALNN